MAPLKPDWEKLDRSELLKLRLKDLGLDLRTSDIKPLVDDVMEELQKSHLSFNPKIFIGDEWFSPEGEPAVAIPFFLVHPRLRALEREFMLEVEGEDPEYFKSLLRHEIGHAFDHAFKVSKRKLWQKIFGSPTQDYHPENYRPRPYSKSFVQNIRRWYGQSHPDEDFAETFAVWLNPQSYWKKTYRGWGALKKLEYVEQLAEEFKGRVILEPKGRMISDARQLSITLEHYYDRKRREFAEDYPSFYDRDLKKIFAERSERGPMSAAVFMRKNRKAIVAIVCDWTRERKVTVEGFVGRLLSRVGELDLVVHESETVTFANLTAFLSTLVSNYLFTGHFKRKV